MIHYQGTWWGESDDMIFIDDDTWPPSMHGTGGEDYFSQGWGMQKNAYPILRYHHPRSGRARLPGFILVAPDRPGPFQ